MPENHLTGQNGQYRKDIYPGLKVQIVLKHHQASGILTTGIVQDILTPNDYHSRGIKVRLKNKEGENLPDELRVGRVQYILGMDEQQDVSKIVIGMDGDKLLNYFDTLNQLKYVKNLILDIETRQGMKITWKHLDNPDQSSSIMQTILRDRMLRVDQGKVMGDKPRCCVLTIHHFQIVKLEYYEGKEDLELVYDLRRKDLYH